LRVIPARIPQSADGVANAVSDHEDVGDSGFAQAGVGGQEERVVRIGIGRDETGVDLLRPAGRLRRSQRIERVASGDRQAKTEARASRLAGSDWRGHACARTEGVVCSAGGGEEAARRRGAVGHSDPYRCVAVRPIQPLGRQQRLDGRGNRRLHPIRERDSQRPC
jgi:hypothetical protein